MARKSKVKKVVARRAVANTTGSNIMHNDDGTTTIIEQVGEEEKISNGRKIAMNALDTVLAKNENV